MTVHEIIRKFNRFIHFISVPLNWFNLVVGLLIGIAHVYIPVPSLTGFVLGCVLSLSGVVNIAINNYFTTKNTAPKKETLPGVSTRKSNLFMALALPCLLLNSAGMFFGMYTGVLLTVAALAFPIAPALTFAMAMVLATAFTVGTLIQSWLQVYSLWEGLKEPAPSTAQSRQPSNDTTASQSEVSPADKLAYLSKARPPVGETCQYCGCLFAKVAVPTVLPEEVAKQPSRRASRLH